MGALVVLAVSLAVTTTVAAVLAALQVRRGVSALRGGIDASRKTLAPLLDELSAETAVSATEVEAVSQRLEAFMAARRRRARGLPSPAADGR